MTLKEFIFDHGALSEHKHRHVVFPSDFQPFLLWSCDFRLNIKRVVKFRSDEGLTLEMSTLKLCKMAYRYIINSVDRAKLSSPKIDVIRRCFIESFQYYDHLILISLVSVQECFLKKTKAKKKWDSSRSIDMSLYTYELFHIIFTYLK